MTKATHIYHNGTILTMDSRCSAVECCAVAGDRILAVGSAGEMAPFKGEGTEYVDLKGKTMLPGFYDGHSHFMRAGNYYCDYLDINCAPIGTVRSMRDIADAVRKKAADTPKGEWILCQGYDDTALAEGRHFTLEEVDAMCPDHPLFLRHISGHLGVVNSLALKMAGITEQTPNPPGGVFVKRDGKLTGLLQEPAAINLVLEAAPEVTEAAWRKAAAFASNVYTAKGVTSAHEGGCTTDMWDCYFKAHEKGLLKNRVQLLPRHGSFDFTRAPATPCPGMPLTDDGMLTLGAVKLFQDGSLQGYTGYLSNPYSTAPDGEPGSYTTWRGFPIHAREALVELVKRYHRQGWQVAIHGNGDAGIEDILVAYEEAQKEYPSALSRDVVIHCQTAREDQLDRIARLGVVVSFFVVHTYYWGARHRDIFLGKERAARINPLRSALERHIPFSLHNDTSITPIDPLLSVWSAANRLTSDGEELGPQQCIPVVDALKSITIWAAYQHHRERDTGSIEPGKLADFTVLEENPLTVDKKLIKDIPVACTIVGNKAVYGAL